MIAIDCGKQGGFAWAFKKDCSDLQCAPMPETEGDIVGLLRGLQKQGHSAVTIEDPAKVIMGAGHASLATLHRNVGFIEGVAGGLGLRTFRVSPRKWQGNIGMRKHSGEKQTAWKNRLKGEAQRRVPFANITLRTADAVLILLSSFGEGASEKTNQTKQ